MAVRHGATRPPPPGRIGGLLRACGRVMGQYEGSRYLTLPWGI